jgi:glycosyltransferase involved in cell wall biosynthesis
MLVIVTNIPTPYRTAFFNTLNDQLQLKGIGFHVLYCAETEPRRYWIFNGNENNYSYTFLKGFHPKFEGFYPHINFGLISTLKKLKPEYLIVAGSWNAPSTINILLNKNKIKAKIIFWSEGHADAQRSKNNFITVIRKKVFSTFDAFLVPNDRSKEYAKSLNSNALIGFLPNTIDEDFYSIEQADDIEALRIKYKIDVNKKLFLCVATLSDRKGVFELLEAYNLLESSIKDNLILAYIGTGALLEKMEDYIKLNSLENILILGQRDKFYVRDFLKLSDVFVLPTKLDANPLTPIEASFMRKPLLLSYLAGNFNELVFEDNGIGIKDINIELIRIALKHLFLLESSNIQDMGNNSYKNVSENFTREKASLRLIDFLDKL